MRYSLDARFRGFALGALVGEYQGYLVSKENTGTENQDQENQEQDNNYLGSQLLLGICDAIVETRGQNFEPLWEFLEPVFAPDFKQKDCKQDLSKPDLEQNKYLPQLEAQTELAVLASLPISLFFHDNWVNLRSQLDILVSRSGFNRPTQDWIYVFGWVLSAFAREEVTTIHQLENIIPLILDGVAPADEVSTVMMLIDSWLRKNIRLSSIETELNQANLKTHTNIAIALYCLLGCGGDLRLSIIRLAIIRGKGNRNKVNTVIGASILGALLGTYNSEIGIPIDWYTKLENISFDRLKVRNCTQVLKLADELLLAWSGIYLDGSAKSDLAIVTAVASPRVMRLR